MGIKSEVWKKTLARTLIRITFSRRKNLRWRAVEKLAKLKGMTLPWYSSVPSEGITAVGSCPSTSPWYSRVPSEGDIAVGSYPWAWFSKTPWVSERSVLLPFGHGKQQGDHPHTVGIKWNLLRPKFETACFRTCLIHAISYTVFWSSKKKEEGLRKPFNALYNKTTTLKPPMVMLEGIKVPSRTRPAQPERW